MKQWWKSKTMWMGFATSFVGLIMATAETAPMDPQTGGIVLAVLGGIQMVLRTVTSTALGSE